jgi:hypothetical protein
MTAESVTCPRCGMTSHHPRDVAAGYCGNCHDWTSPPRGGGGTGLRFRVYLDHAPDHADEGWVFTGDADDDATIARLSGLCREASEAGRYWLLEVHDPDNPGDELRLDEASLGGTAVRVTVFLRGGGYDPSLN